jgi:hypothetical protein
VVGCGGDNQPSATSGADGGSGDLEGGGGPSDEAGGDDAPAPDVPTAPPSYCTGLVFYASFDNALAADYGGGPTTVAGGASRAQGRFGDGVSLASDAGGLDGGAAVYFQRDDAGTAVIYPQSEGSIAFWFRVTGTPGLNAVFYRPLAASLLTTAGLVLGDIGGFVGLFRDVGTGPVLYFPASRVAPYLRDGDYNHYFAAWHARDDAGAGARAYMVLNGGLGEVLRDASVDAAEYADASPDDAGNLGIPYRAQSSSPWGPYPTLAALRVGGTTATVPQGTMDDVAVWNRVLSYDEVANLYRSQRPVGAVCKPPP